jgi:tRNA(fMet)-specific endonuclease VapC
VIHLDSSFVIDFLEEVGRERLGPAFEFLETLPEGETLAASVHVICELRAGVELGKRAVAEQEELDALFRNLRVVHPDERFAAEYARLFAATRRGAKPIASMDLLIATAARLDDAPLVTRNLKDFARVPGLRTLAY